MCTELPDPRLVPGTRRRIDNCDYDAVFSRGGCFHFALRLHQRFGYKMRGMQSENDAGVLGHVWCLKGDGDKGIDIRGIYPEDLIVRLANGGKLAKARDVTADEVERIILAKRYPRDLAREILELADRIITTHERFELGKPVDPRAQREFLRDIGAEPL